MHQEAAYDALAGEYYDARHQTSRNFDVATIAALASLDLRFPGDLALDVGCGRGRCGEFLQIPPKRIVQLDNSPLMLGISPREPALLRILHDAESLPFPERQFGTVAAFLCDAFLGLNFLAEAKRVLRPGGILIGTTPSTEWGLPLREGLMIDPMMTRFVLRDGSVALVHSALYSQEQLRKMLRRVGFDDSKIAVRGHRLPPGTTPVSPDIERPAQASGVSAYDLEIIYSFTAQA
jgi:SAM-dependent methyltransferase